MSVEENKRNHQTLHEELWMKGNVDIIDDLMVPEITFIGMKGHDEIKRRFREYYANPDNPRVERVEHHVKIGEGDFLAIWQTNHLTNGTTVEGVTFQRYDKGKLAESHWFPRPTENQQPE